jgi:hypothetical protein
MISYMVYCDFYLIYLFKKAKSWRGAKLRGHLDIHSGAG